MIQIRKTNEAYKRALNLENITFASNANGQNYKQTLIEDFYYMSQCDCLIRPRSTLSWAAQMLGKHKIIMFPAHTKWVDDKLIIDKVSIIERDKDWHRNKSDRYTLKIRSLCIMETI